MKGITAFACMNDVDEALIAESLTMFDNPYALAMKEYRREKRRALFQSPLWAAMICAVVSLSILSAIVMAGNGVFTPSTTTPPETEITATETDTQEPAETERRPASTSSPNWESGTKFDPPRPEAPTVQLPSPPWPSIPDPTPDLPGPTFPGQSNNSSGPIRNPNLNPNPGIP